MIYLYKQNDNSLKTDSWLDYIPTTFNMYLDDVLVGEYLNTSIDPSYFVLAIPAVDIEGFQSKEYKLKLFTDGNLVKEELLVIKFSTELEIKSINKSNTIKMYES